MRSLFAPAAVLAAAAAAAGGCQNELSGPSAVVAGAPSKPEPSTKATVDAATTPMILEMPVALSDGATAAYGIWPFGAHGGGHAYDGHPGWDIEYRPGADVLAPAEGVVGHIVADTRVSSRFTMRIFHGQSYATDYTNLAVIAPGVVAGARVVAGQPLGIAATETNTIGQTRTTYAMIHFQFNDFSRNEGSTNPNATAPESYLSPAARAVFDALWENASYYQELTEPFPSQARDVIFPLTRTWTLESGSLPARIDFRRLDPNRNEHEYDIVDGDGSPLESGTAVVKANRRPSLIDLQPAGGGHARLGIYDIVSDRMRLALGAPGAPRPTGLEEASVYRTTIP